MSREQLLAMTRREIENLREDRIDLVESVHTIPTEAYTDPACWELEVERVFKRLPLALGLSCELRTTGSYRAMGGCGRARGDGAGEDGAVRAFVNMCSHRGNYVVLDEAGEAKLFRCNYHAWTYDLEGELRSVFDGDNFGEIDRSCHGLTPLPTAERAGLIWVTLNPDSKLDIDAFLSGYGGMLDLLRFEESHLVGRQEIDGPNWKVATTAIATSITYRSCIASRSGPTRPIRPITTTGDLTCALSRRRATRAWPTRRRINGTTTR